jgi:hypothetical protein
VLHAVEGRHAQGNPVLPGAVLSIALSLPALACGNEPIVTDGFPPFGEAFLTGTVVDPTDAPVAQALVSFEVRLGSCTIGQALPAPRPVTTNAAGKFGFGDTQTSSLAPRPEFVACVKATAEPPAGLPFQPASETVAVLYRAQDPLPVAEFFIQFAPPD